MQSFQRLGGYASSLKNSVTSTAQFICQNPYIQSGYQTISAPIYSCASFVKNTVTDKTKSIWNNDGVQAMWQGLFAPFYSYDSFQKIKNASQDLRTSWSRAKKLNSNYAMQALGLYILFYRIIHPALQEHQRQQDSESWTGSTMQLGSYGFDLILWAAMMGYLTRLQLLNTVQNIALTSAITCTAGSAMEKSKDFKPCNPAECGSVHIGRADVDSIFFYVGNRYIVKKLSQCIESSIPNYYGKALAFVLEAVSIGLPLVEYKYSAVGRCTVHKYKEMLSSYKTYCIMYGASFVAATWLSYGVLSAISGEKNEYIYDAVFSFMFQAYALLAISREKKFPGNDNVNIDIVKWLKYFAEQPATERALKALLGELYSIETLVQTPGVGLLLSVRDREIKQGIDSVRGGIQQIRDIQSSRLYSSVKWFGSILPYQIIPEEVQTVCKSVSKTALSKLIRRTEDVLEIARIAEIKRGAEQTQLLSDRIEDYIPRPEEKKPEQKALPALQVITSLPSPPRVAQEVKSTVILQIPEFKPKPTEPIEVKNNLESNLLANIDSAYFEKNKEPIKNPVVSQHSATLFAKKEKAHVFLRNQGLSRNPDRLASLTASIISKNVARRKV